MRANDEISVTEQLFITLSVFLLISSESITFLFSNWSQAQTLTYIILFFIYFIATLLIFWNLSRYSAVISRTWILWALVVLSILSTFWAVLPGIIFRRSVALLLTTSYGIYIAGRVSQKEMIYLLARVFALVIVLNLFVIVAFPELGVHSSIHFGAWRGSFSHKNSFGMMMLFASLIYFTLALHCGRSSRVYWVGYAGSACLVIASHSQTSLVVLFITCACTPLFRAIRWPGMLSKAFYISGFLIVAFSSYAIAVNIEELTALLGRDVTLTGRTILWQDGLVMIRQQPWFGYGFGSDWIYESWGYTPAWHPNLTDTLSLHNGYLELIAQIGVVGFLLYALFFIFLFIRAVLFVERTDGILAHWPLYFLSFFFVYNFFEAEILHQNNFVWIMFVMLSCWLTAPLPERARESLAFIGVE